MNRHADPVPAAQPPIDERRAVTDSPWFWTLIFSGMAWVALMAMDHKFGRRQAQVEHRFQAREYIERQGTRPPIAQVEDGEADFDVDYAAPERTVISLWPLRFLALAIMCVSAVLLTRARLASLRTGHGDSMATVPDKGSR